MLESWALLGTVAALLGLATASGQWLRRSDSPLLDRRAIDSFNARLQAWWFFSFVVAVAFVAPGLAVTLFGLISFWALREFVTLTPTRSGDHRALFWVFFLFTPMQFVLVYLDKFESIQTYGLFSMLIPVYAFLFIAARSAFAGDFDRFLERIAKVQCALMICVYCLSFAPALLFLDPNPPGGPSDNALLLGFFVTVVLASDLLQWFWSKSLGQNVIAPAIDPTKTWEGVAAGAGSTAVVGALLFWATPYAHWYHAAMMALLIAAMAAAGSLTMAAIRRDRGELASGNFVEGHGGVLSRIDSLCFAAPVFYHVTRFILPDLTGN
ncbi:MAG: phosphatidate cytidylyltransferase [Planctomycetales bacterium]|nr:phosphatidate cytidylyltransferase [Planctomycetales bacterium]